MNMPTAVGIILPISGHFSKVPNQIMYLGAIIYSLLPRHPLNIEFVSQALYFLSEHNSEACLPRTPGYRHSLHL